jgi:NTP pyrophosphatase (non-canonical NTP hydrolase)
LFQKNRWSGTKFAASPDSEMELLMEQPVVGCSKSNMEPKPQSDLLSNSLPSSSSVTLQELQQRVDDWIRTVGVRYFSELTNLAVLMEEVGELSRLMARTYGDQSFKKTDLNRELADEMADVLFVLVCLANQTNVNLTEAIQKNLEKKTSRDAERHKSNPKLSSGG